MPERFIKALVDSVELLIDRLFQVFPETLAKTDTHIAERFR